MSLEQYQFLRYYLPGSLLLLYLGMIIAPLSSLSLITSIGGHPDTIVSLALGAFVLSPVLGYMIYTFYDTIVYNWRFMDWNKRASLRILSNWAYRGSYNRIRHDRGKRKRLRPSAKGLIDFIIHLSVANVGASEAATNLRSYWSNYAARFICATLIPFYAAIISASIWSFNQTFLSSSALFSFNPGFQCAQLAWLLFDCDIIVVVSIALFVGMKNPREEAFELERYIIETKMRYGSNRLAAARSNFREKITEVLHQQR